MTKILYSTLMLTLLTLTPPLLMSIISPNKKQLITMTKTAVKVAFYISLIPPLYFALPLSTFITINKDWTITTTFTINTSFVFDLYSSIFIPVALFVTQSILEFAQHYMHKDPYLPKFFKYLLIFLMSMMIMVTANNLLQLFIGWEGVGIMSFLLIGWWWSRTEAQLSALQAIIYNRMGDIGLLLSMAWLSTNLTSWELQQFQNTTHTPLLPLLGLILAATGKSAQFGLHPWLPSAMEGPTPVSALLHSSTMVVAGIFLLIRMHPILSTNKTALSICLCLGAITTLFAAICALTQNDIKKIIAFSTSSQLGLMMVTIGLNQPQLALLHICMHAFFKSMLFLCAGSISHNLNNEQDIRKMGGLHKCLPITSTCLTVGNLALMGMPFLTAFYSKDTIIETMTTSHLNSWALLMTLAATSLTAVYTLRMTMLVQTGPPQHISMLSLKDNPKLTKPITQLAKGSIITGLLLWLMLTPTPTQSMTMPTYIKIMALMVTILGILTAIKTASITNKLPTKSTKLHNFSNMLGYYDTMTHRSHSKKLLSYTQTLSTHMMDQSWHEYTGPKALAKTQKTASMKIPSLQKGLIKLYMISFIMTIALTMLL